jgi:hypothetical protein
MIMKIINFVLFQAAWFSCVISGAHQTPLIAVAVSSAVIAVNLSTRKKLYSELRLMAAVTGIGFCVDSANLLAGVFSLRIASFDFICPLWLVLIWAVFGTTLRSSLGWLAGRYWLSAALGAVAGAPSYFAGAKLGAVTMNSNWIFSAIALTVTWALVMPLLVWLAHGRSADFANQPEETSE